MIKAVVWDIGGVLIENPKIDEFWQGKGRGLRDLFGAGKITKSAFIKKATNLLGVNKRAFLEKYHRIYSETARIEEVINIYKKIKAGNFIFTDTNPIREELIRDKTRDIYKIAKNVFISYKLRVRKDDSAAYKILIAKLGFKPKEVLVIDDKKENVKRAKAEGMNGLRYENSGELKRELVNLNLID